MSFLTAPASEWHATHAGRLWLYLFGAAVLTFLVAPTLLVIPMSFGDSAFLEFPPRAYSLRWYNKYFSTPEWRDATWVSIRAALATVVLATPIGTAAAYALHVAAFRFGRALTGLLVLPTLVPSILTAVGIFIAYARLGLLNTMTGLVLAHTMMAIPFVVVMVSAALKNYDMNQERAARSLGCSRLGAFLRVTFPQIRFSIASAGLFSFIISFDEVIIGLFVATGPASTITRRMFLALSDIIDPTIAAISTLLIGLSITILLLVQLVGSDPSRRTR